MLRSAERFSRANALQERSPPSASLMKSLRFCTGALAALLIAAGCSSVTPGGNGGARFGATSHLAEFHLPDHTAVVDSLATGPDGNMWFTEPNRSKIGKITQNGVITEFTVPSDPAPYYSQPRGIAAGPDGNLWFANDGLPPQIGKITTSGSITQYSIPTDASLRRIVAGPDGNLWFDETAQQSRGVAKITTGGSVTEYRLSSSSSGTVLGLAAGPDGNVWFTQLAPDEIGNVTPAGTVTQYAVPPVGGQATFAYSIVTGSDGNLWFTDSNGQIGKMTPRGTVTDPVQTANQANDLTTALDGNIWFTEHSGIGRLTTTSVLTEFAWSGMGDPVKIAVDNSGFFWLTETAPGVIARFIP